MLWPLLRPDLFRGLPAPPPSLLLFGPRGAGRALLARCLAQQLGAAFLRLSGAALVSKWLGDGDKILQASFLVARCRQPAVVFLSEVDLLLAGPRGGGADGPVTRLHNQLLLQLDAVLSSPAERVLVVCSTSRPEDIPQELRRFFTKRLLVPLPDGPARRQILRQLLEQNSCCLSEEETGLLVQRTEGLSGRDVAQLGQEAVLSCLHGRPGPEGHVRAVSYQDFDNVFCKFQPSTSQKELDEYAEWNKTFGCQ